MVSPGPIALRYLLQRSGFDSPSGSGANFAAHNLSGLYTWRSPMKLAALYLFLAAAAITIAVALPAAQAGICAGCG